MGKATKAVALKRPHETDLEFRSRIARERAEERDRTAPLVTPEAERHGDYRHETLFEVDDSGAVNRIAATRNRQASSLGQLHESGKLTDDQFFAAQRIAWVAERLERNANTSCASMEARVDCSGSGKDVLVETLHAVRLERAYSEWRLRLPMPRRMIVDMVIADRALKVTARVYGMGWPRAFRLLRNSLDLWDEIFERVRETIEQSDVDDAHSRLTCARKCA